MAKGSGPLLAIAGLALCVGLAWIALSPFETPMQAADTARALPGEQPSTPTSAIDASASAQNALRALEVDASSVAERAAVASSPPFDSQGAIWVEGRVIFPPGTPADERADVVAHYDDEDAEAKKPHRARVTADGAFRVAYPAGTEHGSLELRARYVFLCAQLRIAFADPRRSLVLEPELGGCVHATLVVPDGSEGRRGELVGTSVSVDEDASMRAVVDSTSEPRSTPVEDPAHVDIGGLVPGIALHVFGEPKTFAPFEVHGVHVQPGSVTALEVRLANGISLSGQLVDEHEQPIAGGKFQLRVSNGNSTTYIERDTPTGADGRFILAGIPTGRITLTATALGFLATRVQLEPVPDGGAHADLHVVMQRGRSIRGRVQWADGRPAADAKLVIALVTSMDLEQQWNDLSWSENPEHATGADGAFEIPGLTAGPFVLIARATSGTDASRRGSVRIDSVASGGEPVVLTLDEGHEVQGRVVDDTGHAVEHFQVSAVPAVSDAAWQDVDDAVTGRSLGQDGRFVVEGVRAGTWRLIVRGDKCVVRREVSVPGDGAPFDILLPRPASISGVVVDPEGQPVRGARVSHSSGRSPRIADDTLVISEPTGAEGRFVLAAVPPGPATLTASHFRWAPGEAEPVDLAPGATLTDLVAPLRASGRLTGEVRDANGRGDPARQLYLFANRGASSVNIRGECDADGRFEFEGLSAGDYWLQTLPSTAEQDAARGADGVTDWTLLQPLAKRAQAEVVAGETVHVVLGEVGRAPVRVSGHISARGRPVRGASISTNRFDPKGGASGTKSARADDDGGYEIVLDEPGQYWFNVRDGSRGTMCQRLETVPEQAQASIDFELPSGRIAGRVLTADGEPARGLQVELRSKNQSAFAAGALRTSFGNAITREDGQFAFEYLLPGAYRVRTMDTQQWGTEQAARYGPASADDLVLAENAAIEDIELKLQLAGRLEVEVVGPGGEPVAGAAVFTFEESGAAIEDYSGTATDAAGRKRVGGLPARRVLAFARKGSLVSAVSAPVQMRAGEIDHVRLDVRPGTKLDVIIESPDGIRPGPASVRDERGIDYSILWSRNPAAASQTGLTTRGFAVGPLPPGRYRVTPRDKELEQYAVDVIVAGEELREVKLTPPK